jgi:hypothetical protein
MKIVPALQFSIQYEQCLFGACKAGVLFLARCTFSLLTFLAICYATNAKALLAEGIMVQADIVDA